MASLGSGSRSGGLELAEMAFAGRRQGKLGMAAMPRQLTVSLNLSLTGKVASDGCLNGAMPGI